jgi:predicted enzyme related to lactoylglutathione lyase
MAIATWQDLCVDALDVEAQSRFWETVTGLEAVGPLDHRRLVGPTPRHTIYVNEVDRPHTVKNRLHLDIYTASIGDLTDLGATVLELAEQTGFGWTVLADPEGNEFCAFLRQGDALPAYRLHGIGIDSVDPQAQARWWGEVFGIAPTPEAGEDWWTITGAGPDDVLTLDFAPVPEPRTVPNRVHWDVQGRVADLLAAGATHLWDTEHWVVLADPEGNEFCVFETG